MLTKTSSLFLDALNCSNHTHRPPIWLMRQAGRYLKSYRDLRLRYSLIEMFHHPEIIVEVTQQPLRILNLDAAIVFADLLTVLDGLGIRWNFEEGQGPIILDPVETITKIQPAEEVYAYLGEAIRQLKQELSLPLIGFAGAPFTVASYLIERKSSKDHLLTKQWMYRDPKMFHKLLQTVADAVIDLLNYQIDAGVDALQIFDSWAGVLTTPDFKEVSLHYFDYILKRIKNPKIPVILFCRGSSFFAKELASLAPAAISIDWQGELSTIRTQIPTIALQGNLDPAVLFGPREKIKQETERILSSMQNDPGYIFNLGHGILPGTPFENVQFLVDLVTMMSPNH